MVTLGVEERKDVPSYDLDQIRRLAQAGQINFAGDQVYDDTAAIGFDDDDVCKCVCRLTSAHFKESILYPDLTCWQDVYLIADAGSGEVIYELYIKFKLYGSQSTLFICSFHEQGRKK